MKSSNSDGYLVLCAYAIALLDLVSAVLFAVVSGMLYAKNNHWTSLVALIFTIFWIIIIIVLAVGIYKRHLILIRCWLVFTCLGILLDGIILIYGLSLAVSVNWEGVKITVIPFVGLAVEMTFVYIVHLLYLEMTKFPDTQSHHQHKNPRTRAGSEKKLSEMKVSEANEKPAKRNVKQSRVSSKEEEYEYKRQKRLAKEQKQRDKAVFNNQEKRMRHG